MVNGNSPSFFLSLFLANATPDRAQTHNTTETRALMNQLVGPQFNGSADYDCIVQCMFHDVQDFVRMKKDPFYVEHVMPDHEAFADTRRSK